MVSNLNLKRGFHGWIPRFVFNMKVKVNAVHLSKRSAQVAVDTALMST